MLAGLALIAAKGIIRGDLPFDRFLLSLGSLAVAGASFRPLAGIINEVSAAGAPATRLREALTEPVEDARADQPDLPRHSTDIAFEGLGFRYPNADHPALVDVTLKLSHGERIAVVGPNGSGKTTLLSMLPQLLKPDAGRIMIDGRDVEAHSLRSLREQIGVVTQETFIIHGTIAQNIAFGVEQATREQIEEVAALAHADEFIGRMPEGYDTMVAEQGASLSGGQRQRIGIARALAVNPEVLFCDEPVSALDVSVQADVINLLKDLQEDLNLTMLFISHDLAVVKHIADRVAVMHEGEIVELLPAEEIYTDAQHDYTKKLLSAIPIPDPSVKVF